MLQKHENINLRRKKHEYRKIYYNSTKWAIFLFYNQLRRFPVTNSTSHIFSETKPVILFVIVQLAKRKPAQNDIPFEKNSIVLFI